MNRLYYGDCLTIMQELPSEGVDLIYLDPPFNSNRAYNAIYKDETGRPLPDQIEAFCDLWTLDEARERAIRTMPVLMREAGIADETVEFWRFWMNALRETQPRMLAYLSYMVPRLVEMRRLLRRTGSLYLHCDSTASHYIKVMLDGIFGHDNFRDEVVWQRAAGRAKGSQHEARTFGRDVDYILHYSRAERHTHHAVTIPLSEDEAAEKFPHVDDQGRRYNTLVPIFCSASMGARPNLCYTYRGVTNPHPSGWRVSRERLEAMDANGEIIWREGKAPLRKSFAEDYRGKPLGSLWTDIPNVTGGSERMGYATQKPIALMERIITASSKKGDLVLDPFCGCASTLEAAHRLERRWMGIDIAIHAVKRVAAIRLGERCELKQGEDYEIRGVPRTLEGAQDLWSRDKYHFQKWAVEEVDGFVTTKRTADGGIDGRIYFDMPDYRDLQSMVLEVKGGKNVTIADLRALHSVLEREEAQMAGLITMEPLPDRKRQNFGKLMAEAGEVEVHHRPYSRMQILSVPEILEGKRFDTPWPMGRQSTVRRKLFN